METSRAGGGRLHRGVETDPRRHAPGVLDGSGRPDGGGRGSNGCEEHGGAEEGGGEWVAVVRGGGGRRGGKGGKEQGGGVAQGSALPGGGSGLQPQRQPHSLGPRAPNQSGRVDPSVDRAADVEMEGAAAGDGVPQAPQPRDLPPMRLVEIPTLPRRTLAKKAEAASEKVERLLEKGVGEAKLDKAREEKDRLFKELRAAGGATEKTLSFTIKGEDDRVERAERALRRAIEDKQKKEAKIAELQLELAVDEEGIAWHRQRLQRALEYREYLATQKWGEAASEQSIQHLRVLAAAMSPQDPEQARARAWALRTVELGSAREEVDLVVGDTDSEEGVDGEAGGDGSAGADSERTRLGSSGDEDRQEEHGAEKLLARRLEEARSRLAALQAQQSQALGAADGPLGRGKRNCEGEVKEGDRDGDLDMVPALTALQVVTLFGPRLQEAEAEVRECQTLLARAEAESGGGRREEMGGPREGRPETEQKCDAVHPPAGHAAAGDGGGGASREDRPSDQGGGEQRGRPRRRPGYESWVTAEEADEAQAGENRTQRRHQEGRRPVSQGPRASSREKGPGPCRWSSGAGSMAEGRRRSADGRPVQSRGWRVVEREFAELQRAGEDLESRVRDNLEVARQERMQQVQESEIRESQMARVVEVAKEIEARVGSATEGRLPRDLLVGRGAELPVPPRPTFGPTGQRLDEQQHLLRAAAAGTAAERGSTAATPPSAPRRRGRWGDESEAEEEGTRERSQRGTRAPRMGRGAMEEG